MTGLILKLILCPLGIMALSWTMPAQLHYPSMYYAAVTGLAIALVGHTMELLLLHRKTVWISTFLDFGAAALITYASQYLINEAYITYTGASVTGAVFAFAEHFQHLFLVSTGKTET